MHHELAKRINKLIESWKFLNFPLAEAVKRDEINKEIIVYMTERAEWLFNKNTPHSRNEIMQAFEIQEESLEEIFRNKYAKEGGLDFEQYVNLARTYFKKHPEKLKD